MTLIFILSMPGRNSWNGKWSGDESVFAIKRKFTTQKAQAKAAKIIGHHGYNFGDGWRAGIEVKAVEPAECRQIMKRSKGFCGYDWMVDSIVKDGAIYGPTQPKPEFQPA